MHSTTASAPLALAFGGVLALNPTTCGGDPASDAPPAMDTKVTFSGTVQFCESDLNSTQTGTYAISTVAGMRVMRFAGHTPTIMNHTRVVAEVSNAPGVVSGSRVYMAREVKPQSTHNMSTTRRLNTTSRTALRTQLGI